MGKTKIEIKGLTTHPTKTLVKMPVGSCTLVRNRKGYALVIRNAATRLKREGRGVFYISVNKKFLREIGANEADVYVERIK